MRIVIIADHAFAEGGAPQVAIASAKALAQAGHDVVYLHGVGHSGDGVLESTAGITRVGLGGRDIWQKSQLVAARDGIWNRDHRTELGRLLAGWRADGRETILHVHQWTKFFSPSLFAAIARANLPVVVSLHDYFLTCPTGLMYRFDRAAPCALAPLSAACLVAPCDPRSPLHKLVRIARTFALNRAIAGLEMTAIHVSEAGRATIGRYLPSHIRQHVLENPIEIEDRGMRAQEERRTIVFCGRLTPEKGAELVARAARAAGLPALFIGEGPSRAAIAEILPEAEITGWLPREDVRDLVASRALALAAPSLWPETGPLVVAEAMADGVPVIVSNRAGAASRVSAGENGLVVEPEENALAAAFASLLVDGTAARLGAAAFRHFRANPPGLARHAAGLLAIYQQTLAEWTQAAEARRAP